METAMTAPHSPPHGKGENCMVFYLGGDRVTGVKRQFTLEDAGSDD